MKAHELAKNQANYSQSRQEQINDLMFTLTTILSASMDYAHKETPKFFERRLPTPATLGLIETAELKTLVKFYEDDDFKVTVREDDDNVFNENSIVIKVSWEHIKLKNIPKLKSVK